MTKAGTQPRTYPEGVTSWVDLEVDDVDAAQAFYGGLFGWTFTQATPPEAPVRYLVAQLDGQDVGGIGSRADSSTATPTWNTYVAVDDIEAAASRIVAAGGRVIDPPSDAGEGGRAATCADPAGVQFRLWQARRRLGAQMTNTPGSWNFSDLVASDPTASARFYGQVFGWEFDDLGFSTMVRRPGYGDHLASTIDPGIHERQSGVAVPPGFADAIAWLNPAGDASPGWQVTFTVADRDETAARAEALGGTVVRRGDTEWTKDAVIADLMGAEFIASQFTPPEGGY